MAKISQMVEVKEKIGLKNVLAQRVSEASEKVKNANPVGGFLTFVREQGVVGLSIGIVLGGAVTGLTKSLVADIISPLLSLVLGRVQDLQDAVIMINEVEVKWGSFVVQLIDFVIIAAVVYFAVKGLGLDRLDQKKNK